MTVPQGDLPDGLAAVGATIGLVFAGTITPGNGMLTDVSQYASMLVTASLQNPANPCSLVCSWYDQFNGVLVDQSLLSAAATNNPAGGTAPSWILPVRAGQLGLGTNIPGGTVLRVIGLPVTSEWRMNYDRDPARALSGLIPAGAATNTVIPLATALVPADTPPFFPNLTSYNGPITISLNSAAGTNGAVEAVWPDAQGNPISTPLLIDSGGGMRSQRVSHPQAFCAWQYRLSAAAPAAAHNCFVSITPG